MRFIWSLFAATLVAGCATQRTAVVAPPAAPAEKPVVRAASPIRAVETRYELRSYRDANDSAVRHDAHVVYRTTRVPARIESLETIPRSGFAPVSFAPLPASAELSAELAAQRQITAELREIKAHMASIEQQAQGQYGTLVNQTAETVKLRQQLEGERARVRELETKLRDRAANATGVPAATTAATETKW